jgi:transcriptional regulator with XRE-family HTH domain
MSNEAVPGWLDGYVEEGRVDPSFVAESLALANTEQAARVKEEEGVSRADLAARMGVSRAYMTKLFNAHPNMTLRSIAQLCVALRLEPELRLTPAREDARATPITRAQAGLRRA